MSEKLGLEMTGVHQQLARSDHIIGQEASVCIYWDPIACADCQSFASPPRVSISAVTTIVSGRCSLKPHADLLNGCRSAISKAHYP